MTPNQTVRAIAACEHIERGLVAVTTRAQQAIEEAMRELRHMVDLINAARAERGDPPLDIKFPPDIGDQS